jgi:predicted O-methyltransferase YrrM
MDIAAFVDECLNKANSDKPDLPVEILQYVGMSGDRTRRLYNAICSRPSTRYLEIGTWYGSSSISALYGNSVNATFIDNWSQFGGNKNILISALEKYKGSNQYTLIESDSWQVDHSRIGLFDVYLYDGGHSYTDQYKGISQYIQHLKDGCIVMIDDWNWADVRNGTLDAFRDLNIEIVHTREIVNDLKDFNINDRRNAPWWNGIGIFVLGTNQYKKQSTS